MKRLSTILCALALLFGVVGVANASEIKTPILLLKGGTINTTDFTVTPLAPSTLTTDNLYAATFTPINNLQNIFQYKNFNTGDNDKIVIKFGSAVPSGWHIHTYGGQFEGNVDLGGKTEYEVSLTGANIDDFTIFNWDVTDPITITECYLVKTEKAEAKTTNLYLAGGWATTIEDVELTGNVAFNFKNAYAAVNLISGPVSLADYPSYELVLASDAPVDKLQFCIKSDSPTANDGYNWSGPIISTTPGAYIPADATVLSEISIQACNVADLGRVEILSFNLIDKDNNKVPTKYVAPASWAADTYVYNATMSFTEGGQWNYGALNGGEGMLLPVTITVSAESFPENVQLNIATPAQVPNWNNVIEDRHEYRGLPVGGTSYSVDIDAVEDGETIQAIQLQHTAATDPFIIKHLSGTISQYRKITVGSAGFTTFSPKLPISVAGIVTAYGAKYDGSKIVLTPVTEIPAGSGVIIEAAENSYKAPVINKAGSLSAINDLLVSDGTVTGDGSTIYALGKSKKDDKVGFLRVANGVTIPAGKAYMVISAGAREFIGFGEDATGVETVKQEAKADNQYFNLSGQRVAQPTKGLYIVNGKKVIIK